jgi:uncharacterized protein (TIGR02118 family)
MDARSRQLNTAVQPSLHDANRNNHVAGKREVTMVKLITIVKRKAGITRDEFIQHWQQVHARMAIEDKSFWNRVRKYVQNYVTSADGPQAWDGVVELWFDSQAELDAAFSGQETKQGLIADLDNFIDPTSMISVVTEENILYDGGSPSITYVA